MEVKVRLELTNTEFAAPRLKPLGYFTMWWDFKDLNLRPTGLVSKIGLEPTLTMLRISPKLPLSH